jgi:hypothetical protein
MQKTSINPADTRLAWIGQTKRHNRIFEVTVSGLEGCLPLIGLADPDPMVGVTKVYHDS